MNETPTPRTDAVSETTCRETVYADFARQLERELAETKSALATQRANYIALAEAVLGDGCDTSDSKDVVEIARQHRIESESFNSRLKWPAC